MSGKSVIDDYGKPSENIPFRKFWYLPILFVILVVLVYKSHTKDEEYARLSLAIVDTQKQIYDLSNTKNEKINVKEYTEVVKKGSISAENIAKQVIDLDNVLTAQYKVIVPPNNPDLDKYKKLNRELRGYNNHVDTWQLNPEWILKLESIVLYQSTDEIPIVFSMTTKSGEDAGMIYAVYDVNSNKLIKISKYYTNKGILDEAEIGGD